MQPGRGKTPPIMPRALFWPRRVAARRPNEIEPPEVAVRSGNLGANGADACVRTFTLVLEDAGGNEQGRVDFRGTDTHQAFILLEREKRAKRASLWEGGRRLGMLELTSDNFWELSR